MADNITLNAGAGGDTIAADDVGGAKYQRVKLIWGADGTVNETTDTSGKRIPVDTGYDGQMTLQASQVSATTNTTTTRTTTTGLGRFTSAIILINITAAGAATGTLQLFLEDSADAGTTWDDLISSNTFTFGATTTTQKFYLITQAQTISTMLATDSNQGDAQAVETLGAGKVRQGPWGDRIRVREVVSGVGGSPTGVTYTITAVFK